MTARWQKISPREAREAVQAYAEAGAQHPAAALLGITRAALQRRLRAAEAMGITAHGELNATQEVALPVPEKGVARYILTAAQNNVSVNPAFWANLTALADHYNARIMIGRIRYNKTAQHVAQEKVDGEAQTELWYAPEVMPHICDDRVQLAPGLIWAGDMNAMPTAANPLSGLDSFTGVASCMFPHTQLALKSIATAKSDPVKINYTTGAVTLADYIKRKAGLKAEFHHAYAALLVEVDADGDWFVRQLNSDSSGTIYDLSVKASDGMVSVGHRIEAFNPGDIHAANLDAGVKQAVWGSGGLVDKLRPRHQIFHDIFDMESRSHHNTALDQYRLHVAGRSSVADEIALTAQVMGDLHRDWAKSWVVKSNHDEHLDRWLRDTKIAHDPINFGFYHEAMAALVASVQHGPAGFDVLEWAMGRAGGPAMTYLARDESLTIAGINFHNHGDQGPNGARGTVANLARTGRKTNIGHSHSANIFAGCYQAGTCTGLTLDYNQGPSSWSHSHILTYANGKRAIITHRGRKWRAQ